MLVCPLISHSLFLSLIRSCYRVTVFSDWEKQINLYIYIYCCKLLVLQDSQIMQFPFNFILHPVPRTMYGIRKKKHFNRKCLLKFGSCMSMTRACVTQRSTCTRSMSPSRGCPQAPGECHLHGKQPAAPGDCFSSYNSSLMRRGRGGSVLNYKDRIGNPWSDKMLNYSLCSF